MTKAIYKFHFYTGRGGSVKGVFVAEDQDVESVIGERVYFGEILGKHSEVYGDLKAEFFERITDSPEAVAVIEEHGLGSGYDPFHYLRWECDECESGFEDCVPFGDRCDECSDRYPRPEAE